MRFCSPRMKIFAAFSLWLLGPFGFWNDINNRMFSNKFSEPIRILEMAMDFLLPYQEANKVERKSKRVGSSEVEASPIRSFQSDCRWKQ